MRKIWSDHSGNRIFVVSLHLLFSETVRLTSPDIKNEMATKYDDYNPEIYYEDKQSEAERRTATLMVRDGKRCAMPKMMVRRLSFQK